MMPSDDRGVTWRVNLVNRGVTWRPLHMNRAFISMAILQNFLGDEVQ